MSDDAYLRAALRDKTRDALMRCAPRQRDARCRCAMREAAAAIARATRVPQNDASRDPDDAMPARCRCAMRRYDAAFSPSPPL